MAREIEVARGWPARIEARSAVALRGELSRALKAGEIGACGPMVRIPGGYAVDVLRLRDRRVAPAWRKPVLVSGGAVVVLGASAAAGWLLVAPTAAVLPWAVGLAVAAVLLWLALRRGDSHGCETTVTVTHRCR